MDDSRDEEGCQLSHESILPEKGWKPPKIDVYIAVQPIVNYNVPFTVVRPKFYGVPPVGVKGSVRESRDFGPEIEPAVQESEESKDQEGYWREHEFDDSEKESTEI